MPSRRSRSAFSGLDFDDCPCTGRTLSKLLHPAVMALLARGPLHGYRIVEELARTPILEGSPPDSTGVYRLLRSLEEQGHLESTWETPGCGPARKTYRLNEEGLRCLSRWVETLETYHRSIGSLLRSTQDALTASSRDLGSDGQDG